MYRVPSRVWPPKLDAPCYAALPPLANLSAHLTSCLRSSGINHVPTGNTASMTRAADIEDGVGDFNRLQRSSSGTRLTAASALGLFVGALAAARGGWLFLPFAGWVTAGVAYLVWTWTAV